MTIINPKRFRGSNKKSSSLPQFSNKFQEFHFGSETTPKLISRDGRRASERVARCGGRVGGWGALGAEERAASVTRARVQRQQQSTCARDPVSACAREVWWSACAAPSGIMVNGRPAGGTLPSAWRSYWMRLTLST